MTDSLYVTTTIPYVNAAPHVGFALELVQADAIVRYYRQLGTTVRFQTGTDENAFKNVLSARERGVPVEQFVAENSARFQSLCTGLDISVDRFVRTTEPGHHRAVHAFLGRLEPEDLYVARYHGLYCAGCEDFYLERDLQEGHCPEHATRVIAIEERNHFFRLSRYQAKVRELIAAQRLRILPPARETEVLQFIDRGLTDISISRDAARSGGWGIPFPGAPGQVVYVWIDALINYLSGLDYGFAGTDRFWDSTATKLHVIGKNVWKFHAVYWPALLLSAGLAVPDCILAHGFLTSAGEKISKSSGKAADPEEYIDRLGSDALRYFLLRHVRPLEDSDFSEERLGNAYDTDLANGIGNLCSRLTTLCEAVELPGRAVTSVADPPAGYHEQLRSFRFDRALSLLWEELTRINQELSAARPWEDVRAGRHEAVRDRLSDWADQLLSVAYWLNPFLPRTAATVRGVLTAPTIRKSPPLFPRTGLIQPKAPR